MCIHACVRVCDVCLFVEVRGQFEKVGFLLLLSGSQRRDSGSQAWKQVPFYQLSALISPFGILHVCSKSRLSFTVSTLW